MHRLAAVGRFKERGAIEQSEAVWIVRKMGRNPIENDADIVLMQIIDQEHQILGRSVATGRGKVTGRLIAPRAVKWMLHQREKFHMGETEAMDVLGQAWRNFAIAQRAISFFRHPHPGAQVDFVDGDRTFQRAPFVTISQPLVILPFVTDVPNQRGSLRFGLMTEGEWVRL